MISRYLLIVLLFASFHQAIAQTSYATVSSKWAFNDGPSLAGRTIIASYAGDTIYAGVPCNIIRKEQYLHVEHMRWDVGNEYYYTNGDSVFQYSNYYNRFILKYRFDVVPGDTVYYPVPYVVNPATIQPDSTFAVIIDSVKMISLENGTLVRKVYTQVWEREGTIDEILETGGAAPNYFQFSTTNQGGGYYIERVGMGNWRIMQRSVAYTADDYHDLLICYSENNSVLYNGEFISYVSCQEAISSVANSPFFNISLSLFPNPVTTTLQLLLPENTTIEYSHIIRVDGVVFPVSWTGSNSIEVKELIPGVYCLQLIDNKGNSFVGKFLKE